MGISHPTEGVLQSKELGFLCEPSLHQYSVNTNRYEKNASPKQKSRWQSAPPTHLHSLDNNVSSVFRSCPEMLALHSRGNGFSTAENHRLIPYILL